MAEEGLCRNPRFAHYDGGMRMKTRAKLLQTLVGGFVITFDLDGHYPILLVLVERRGVAAQNYSMH